MRTIERTRNHEPFTVLHDDPSRHRARGTV